MQTLFLFRPSVVLLTSSFERCNSCFVSCSLQVAPYAHLLLSYYNSGRCQSFVLPVVLSRRYRLSLLTPCSNFTGLLSFSFPMLSSFHCTEGYCERSPAQHLFQSGSPCSNDNRNSLSVIVRPPLTRLNKAVIDSK